MSDTKRRDKVLKSMADKRYREKYEDKIKEYKAKYYQENKERLSKKSAEVYQKNKEAIKKRIAAWKKNNPAKVNAGCMLRHAIKLKGTPVWLTADHKWMIEQAYELAKLREKVCGGVWHVDHIIPLRGKTVCGLHVPWNLQVITREENCKKHNKLV